MNQPFNSNLTTQSQKSSLTLSRLDNLLQAFLEFYQNETSLEPKEFYKGWLVLCPFHNDRNPSLGIYKDGSTYCYSCKKSYRLEAVLRAYEFWAGDVEQDPELKPNLSKLEENQWRVCDHKQYYYTDGERSFIRVRIEFEDIQTRARKKDFYFYQPTIKDGQQVLELVKGYVPLILYRLPEIEDKEWVFFVEGEKCCDALWDLGLPATTLPIGASIKPSREFFQALMPLRGKKVFILPDNDKSGWSYAEIIKQVLVSLGIESQIIPIPKLWDKSDIADYIEVELAKGREQEELRAEIENWIKPKYRVASFWEVMEKEKERGLDQFIVPGLFPAKGLGLLVGRSKLGKTELLCLIVSKLLRGEPVFDRPSEKVKVLWITQEDTIGSIGIRLLLRGITPEELQESLFTQEVGGDAVISKEVLIKEAQRLGCQVVIVEPLLAIKELAELGIKDKLSYGAVYSVLLPLKKEAEKAGVFVLGVHHANKGRVVFKDWTDVIDGALGSTAFSAVPDCILGIGLTPSGDQSLRRVLAKGRGVDLDYLVEWVWEQREEGLFGKYLEKEEYCFEFDLTPEQRRLVEAIRELGEEATPKRLAQRLDKTENSVKVMLHELLDKGVIGKSKRGCYFVSDKKQKANFPNLTNFPNFPNFPNLANFPNLTNLTNHAKVSQKLVDLPNLQSLENSGLEGKVSKVSKVSRTFYPTPNQPTPTPTQTPTQTQTQTPSLSFGNTKPEGTLDKTKEEEEAVYLLMPENEKCPICGCEVWKTDPKTYEINKGGAFCAKCGHISWFGNLSKGKVLESKADVEYFLAELPLG
jgi:hypothetical protein